MSRRSSILPLGNDGEDDESLNAGQDQSSREDQEEAVSRDARAAAGEQQGTPQREQATAEDQASAQATSAGSSSNNTEKKVGPNQTRGAGPTGQVPAIMATNRPIVSLSAYSGCPVGTQGPGGIKEEFTVENWCRRVEMVASSAQWNQEQTASHAALALTPNSPAERWYNYAAQNDALKTWKAFRAAIETEFSPPETVLEKVNMFKSMKICKGERAADFANKLHLKFEKFEKDLEPLWLHPDFNDESTKAEMKERRIKVVAKVMSYLKTVMFAAGLPDHLITEITKAKADTLEKMLEICRLSEAAQAATGQKPKPVAAMAAEGEQSPATKEEIMEMITAALKKEAPKKQKGDKQSKPKDFSKATCYYCGKAGHISPACPGKKEDREKGIYRLSIKEAPMSKEQWNALPKEQKSWKGRQASQGGRAEASASIQTAPAAQQAAPPQFNWWGQYYQEN